MQPLVSKSHPRTNFDSDFENSATLIFWLTITKNLPEDKKIHNNQEKRLQGQLREEEKMPSVEFGKVITG